MSSNLALITIPVMIMKEKIRQQRVWCEIKMTNIFFLLLLTNCEKSNYIFIELK